MNKSTDLTVSGVKHIIIDAEYAGQRVDNFLLTRLKGLPKSRLYHLLRKGELRVNKKRTKPDYRLQSGDNIRIPPMRLTATESKKASPSLVHWLSDKVLYEDNDFILVNKPAGMAVHGGSGINLGIIEVLRQIRPHQKYLELVHRLDKDTSGCLLIAKKTSILRYFHELIRLNKIEKTYIALVKGDWPRSVKQVNEPLYKNQLSSGERIVKIDSRGKPSLTGFKVLERFGSATLMEVRLFTGRTHQIRVHAAHVGHPIAMDEKYGDKEFNKFIKSLRGERLFLHATRLIFQMPNGSNEVSMEAPLPDDLQRCVAALSGK